MLAAPLISYLASGCGGGNVPGVARGTDLYDTCRPCHGKSGEGTEALGAPAIAGLPQWYVEAQLDKFRSGVRGAHPADAEGNRMRPMARSLNLPGDVQSVAQYVASLKARPAHPTLQGGNAAAGEAPYTTVCTVCHGADATGTEGMGAPTLLTQPDWYLLKQLEKYKSGQRGTDTADVTGQQMATMASMLPDHQSMLDVIAYIGTLRK